MHVSCTNTGIQANVPRVPHSSVVFSSRYTTPIYLFTDVGSIKHGVGFDLMSNAPQPIPGVDCLFFGWVCSDASMLNNNRKRFRDDHAKGELADGRSGSTLHWCLLYVQKYRPRLVIAENIVQMAFGADGDQPHDGDGDQPHVATAMEYVLDALRGMGYVAVPLVLHADRLGSAARRKRLYIVACLSEGCAKPYAFLAEQCTRLVHTVEAVAPKQKVQDVMYPRTSELVSSGLIVRSSEVEHGTRHKTNWNDHDDIFKSAGFHGMRDEGQLLQVTSLDDFSLQGLTARQKDILMFLLVVRRTFGAQPREDLRIFDVFHSLKYIQNSIGLVNLSSTVCPNSTLFVYGGDPLQNRILLPHEHFHLMGYDLQELQLDVRLVAKGTVSNANEWEWHELTDLIGNAFDAHSFLTALLTGFMLIGCCSMSSSALGDQPFDISKPHALAPRSPSTPGAQQGPEPHTLAPSSSTLRGFAPSHSLSASSAAGAPSASTLPLMAPSRSLSASSSAGIFRKGVGAPNATRKGKQPSNPFVKARDFRRF